LLNRAFENKQEFLGISKPSTENPCVGGSIPPLATKTPRVWR
jgi:hypothetical protein